MQILNNGSYPRIAQLKRENKQVLATLFPNKLMLTTVKSAYEDIEKLKRASLRMPLIDKIFFQKKINNVLSQLSNN